MYALSLDKIIKINRWLVRVRLFITSFSGGRVSMVIMMPSRAI